MHCAVCSHQMLAAESAHYAVGPMRGRLCLRCQEGLSTVVGQWLAVRMQEVSAEQARIRAVEAEVMPRRMRVVGGGRSA